MLGLKAMQIKRELTRLVREYLDSSGVSITLGCLIIDGVAADLREEALEAATQKIVETQEENQKLKEAKEHGQTEGDSDVETDRDHDRQDG